MRFAAPALMAGNVGLLKHASNVPQTALFLQDLFARAGFPAGASRRCWSDRPASSRSCATAGCAAATLTGSGPAGQSVAAIAGDEVKKVVLELGGSDPFIVLPSADLAAAARVAATPAARTTASPASRPSASSCTTPSTTSSRRLFVEAACQARSVGDPMQDGTDIGPLATEQQRDEVEDLVADAAALGARVLCGGAVPDQPGLVLPADGARRDHAGDAHLPRGSFRPGGHAATGSADIDEAIELANGTDSASAPTPGPATRPSGSAWSRDLAAGMVFINGIRHVLPAAAVRRREALRATAASCPAHGIREFCNIKSVWIGA